MLPAKYSRCQGQQRDICRMQKRTPAVRYDSDTALIQYFNDAEGSGR